ncbi:hypothetical protein CHCC15332_2624 [Bacillus paralicheniformis]|nr:hypothetical protein CHCC15332_2624 [Bacillus paralicheniformis]
MIENPCSLGRPSIGANVGIREHRRAGLTTNARVCRHAELERTLSGFFVRIYFLFDPPGIKNTHLRSEYDMIFETKSAIFARRQKSVCL